MPAMTAMATSEDQMQVLDERFREFFRVFFDPHQCRGRRSVIVGVRFLAQPDSLFTEAVKRLNFSQPVSETENGTDCCSVHETRASESSEQPDIVKSTESSELVQLPTSPDIVPEMDGALLTRQLSEPSHGRKTSLDRSLRQSVSYEDPPMVNVERQLSDPVTLRRLSSAYGSQDQSLSTLNRNGDEDAGGLNREEDEPAVFMTPPSTQTRSARSMTIDNVADDNESTLVLSANAQPAYLSNSCLIFALKAAEHADKSGATNIPTVVAGYQLTDDNEFQSVCATSADESFVTAADSLEQEQLTPNSVQQPLTLQELYAVIADLEKRIRHRLLIALLRENHSPEFVLSVAEALFQPVSEAAIGKCLLPIFYHSCDILSRY